MCVEHPSTNAENAEFSASGQRPSLRVRRRHRRRASASDHGRGRDPDRGRLAKRSFRTKIILRCSAFHVQIPYPSLEPAMQRGNFEGHVLDSLKERKSRVPTCAAQNSTRTVCSCIPNFEFLLRAFFVSQKISNKPSWTVAVTVAITSR